MPLLFSPVDLSELRGPFNPRPRSAFLMLQMGGTISTQEVEVQKLIRKELRSRSIEAVTAGDVPGTTDYLQKIIDLIRGTGFGIAIFSDLTPARTFANIFFELGVAAILGKPVQLVIAGDALAPSDFVRTEWIRYKETDKRRFDWELRRSIGKIVDGAGYYRKIVGIALEADEPDLEEAFERFKQAVLIGDDAKARARIVELEHRLKRTGPGERGDRVSADFASHRGRLLRAVSEFLALLPNVRRRTSR